MQPTALPTRYDFRATECTVGRAYSHFGEVRHRSDMVEYRLEHNREALGERLTALEKLTS